MNRGISSAFTLLAGLALVGCQPKSKESAAVGDEIVLGPQFSAKKGLLLPKESRDSLGLKIVEVTEQKVSASVEFQLRVYQVAENACYASGTVTSEQAKQLKVGEPLQVRINDGRSFAAKITGLSDQLQKATGMVEVLVEIPNQAAELGTGTFLQVSMTLDSRESVVTIPRDALLRCSDGHSVYTVSGEHFVRTPVKVGVSNAEFVEITDGLYAGDQVVLQPVMSLWMTELAAVKGGQACCVMPAKGK